MLPLSAALAVPSLVRRRNVDLENLENLKNLKEGIKRAREAISPICAFGNHPILQTDAETALKSLVLENQVKSIEEAVRKRQAAPVAEYVDNPH